LARANKASAQVSGRFNQEVFFLPRAKLGLESSSGGVVLGKVKGKYQVSNST
jgi:hypothetical protein